MPAALTIITRSLRLIGVLAEAETPKAEQAKDALAAFDALLATWEGDGAPVSTHPLVPTTVPALPDRHLDAMAYCLAVRLAPEYGMEPTATVARIADERERRLKADYAPRPTSQPGIEYRKPRPWGAGYYGDWS